MFKRSPYCWQATVHFLIGASYIAELPLGAINYFALIHVIIGACGSSGKSPCKLVADHGCEFASPVWDW